MSIFCQSFLIAIVLLGHCCLGDDTKKSSVSDETAVLDELRKVGADIELNDLGKATALFWNAPTDRTFNDQQLKLVKGLRDLKDLWLVHSDVTDSGLAELKQMNQLETLVLNCKYEPGKPAKITDDGLKHLTKLTNLRMLRLEDSDVTDAGLIHLQSLKKLEDLSLFGTEISDVGLAHLRVLKNLTYLDVAETQWEKKRGAITVEAVMELQKHLPKCKIDY